MSVQKMTKNERKAVFALSGIMALRMLGLFMVLPLFALYAHQLMGATPMLIGLAMGVYGLTQALLQIPFGMLSDHIGRKPIIALGLILFTLGSVVAALADSINWMILGRALQGMGAIGSTIIAMIADLTRENQRTKAMAINGITIGFSFSVAMIAGPLFANLLGVNGIFWLAGAFSLLALGLLFIRVPTPIKTTWHADAEPDIHQFSTLLKHKELLRLNAGIFLLHIIFTASFIILPISLQNFAGLSGHQQWALYLPTLLLAFFITLPLIMLAERKKLLKEFFLSGIALLGCSEFLLWYFAHNLLLSAVSLLLFFIAFSLLEAFLPSLVSRTAPPSRKGTALGLYSCAQFIGIFVGGLLGGWAYGTLGLLYVYLLCFGLAILWWVIAFGMKKPAQSR